MKSVTGTLPIVVGGTLSNPVVSVNKATPSLLGVVKPDGSTITVNGSGVLTAITSTVTIPGPYADDTAAAAGGVAVGSPYYLGSGFVVIRQV